MLKTEAGMVSPPAPQASLTPQAVGKHEEPRAQALLGATPGNFATPRPQPSLARTSGKGRVRFPQQKQRGARSHSPWKATALALPETS